MWLLLLSALEGLGGDLSWVVNEHYFDENALEKLSNIISDIIVKVKEWKEFGINHE